MDVGTDSSVLNAGKVRIVDHHRIERQWPLLLVARREWRRSMWELAYAFMFWLVLLSPGGLLAGAAAAHRAMGSTPVSLTCGSLGLLAWTSLRIAGVAIGPESLFLMPLVGTALPWIGHRWAAGAIGHTQASLSK